MDKKLTEGEPAKWDPEAKKEIPNEVTMKILEKIFPNMKITPQHKEHISGKDYIIGEKKPIYVDTKNDKGLGLTENICLDISTTNKKGILQLFMNYPLFPKNHLMVYNDLLPPKNILENWVHRREQDYGGYTEAYIVPVKKLKHRIYDIYPKLAHPSFSWFTKERR